MRHLVVVIGCDEFLVDNPGEPGRWSAHSAAGQADTLTVGVVDGGREAGDGGRGCGSREECY